MGPAGLVVGARSTPVPAVHDSGDSKKGAWQARRPLPSRDAASGGLQSRGRPGLPPDGATYPRAGVRAAARSM